MWGDVRFHTRTEDACCSTRSSLCVFFSVLFLGSFLPFSLWISSRAGRGDASDRLRTSCRAFCPRCGNPLFSESAFFPAALLQAQLQSTQQLLQLHISHNMMESQENSKTLRAAALAGRQYAPPSAWNWNFPPPPLASAITAQAPQLPALMPSPFPAFPPYLYHPSFFSAPPTPPPSAPM